MLLRLLTLLCFIPAIVFSQADYTFYNKGADIYIQNGALVHVQGTFTNDNGSANGITENDGILEVKKDFENKANAVFRYNTITNSEDRAVRFVGSGKQAIIGVMDTSYASFYNLVIDQLSGADTVEMRTHVDVKGSIAFGSTNFTDTYNPSQFFPYNGTNGLLKTYTGADEYLLDIQNGSVNAIAGYPTLAMQINPTAGPSTGYIITKGNRGSLNGGVQRMVTNQASYVFPFGTAENGYNAVSLNFTNIPGGGGSVKGKFNDGSSYFRGYIGTISQSCVGCTPSYPTPDNPGFNYYSASNPCTNQPQWVILEESGILDHGYWSFDATNNNTQAWKYVIETFPNSFTLEGSPDDSWRTIKYHDNGVGASQEYGVDPTDGTVDWGTQIMNVESPADLFNYTRFGDTSVACYQGTGVPGGVYTDFSHFSLHKSNSSNALPVELIYLKADAIQNEFIQLSFATALEINNDGFEVLRSTDGVNFSYIGWVDGHDNSTVVNSYTFDDHNVAPNVVYYYKLRQLDNDGASEETYIVSAVITSGDIFVISDLMPNPTRDISKFTITTSTKGNIDVKVFDNIGRLVVGSQAYNLTEGQNDIYINGSNFAAGTYNIVVSTANNVYSKKLVVSQQ